LVIRHIVRGVVVALAARDAEPLLRFVAHAEELGGEDPFTPEVLEELGKLVPADLVSYCEQDRVRQRVLHTVGRRGDECDEGDVSVSYWDIAAEHPVCAEDVRERARKLRAKLPLHAIAKELADEGVVPPRGGSR
jgi:hypothetical protein